jgi:hypothetical protein
MILRLVEFANGDSKLMREFQRLEPAESLGDVSWRGRRRVSDLLAKICITTGRRSSSKRKDPPLKLACELPGRDLLMITDDHRQRRSTLYAVRTQNSELRTQNPRTQEPKNPDYEPKEPETRYPEPGTETIPIYSTQ